MLETPESLGLPQSEQDIIHDQWNTFERVQHRIASEGFTPLPQPMYACPGYLNVETLTAADTRTLSMEFAKYKAWRDFTSERLVYTQQILVQTRNELRAIELRVKREARKARKPGTAAKKMTKEEVLEEAKSDPRYEQLLIQEQEQEQLELMYTAKKSEFYDATRLISRVVELRKQDIETGQRGGNIGAHGAGGYHAPTGPDGGF